MASLENQKKKSPQMVDKVEDLQYTERMRKKDFYINVKKSLLNLLEFSEVRNNTIIVNDSSVQTFLPNYKIPLLL